MAIATIEAEKRMTVGKGAAKRLRREGLIPAILYGDKTTNLSLTIPARELRQVSIGSGQIFKIAVPGEQDYSVLVREVQKHPVSKDVIHLDLFEVSMTELLTTTTALRIIGEARGISEGGILQYGLMEVEIECLPTDIPEAITVDVTDLEIGGLIKVEDLVAPEGVTILTESEQLVASLVESKYEEEEEEAVEETEEVEGAEEVLEEDTEE